MCFPYLKIFGLPINPKKGLRLNSLLDGIDFSSAGGMRDIMPRNQYGLTWDGKKECNVSKTSPKAITS